MQLSLQKLLESGKGLFSPHSAKGPVEDIYFYLCAFSHKTEPFMASMCRPSLYGYNTRENLGLLED